MLKSLSRQRSTMQLDTGSETANGLKVRVNKTRSPSTGSSNSPKALLPMVPNLSAHSSKGSLRVEDSDHSTDSEEESHTHSERENRNKRVAVNDLFTQVISRRVHWWFALKSGSMLSLWRMFCCLLCFQGKEL